MEERRDFREKVNIGELQVFGGGGNLEKAGKQEARGEKGPKASADGQKKKNYDLRNHLETRCMMMTISDISWKVEQEMATGSCSQTANNFMPPGPWGRGRVAVRSTAHFAYGHGRFYRADFK
jgi:hypothetical protein